MQIIDPGYGFTAPPTVSVKSTSGTGANLVAALDKLCVMKIDDESFLGITSFRATATEKQNSIVAYAYCFEGHCYRFDRPKLLSFESDEPATPAAGACGFSDEFKVWRLRADARIVEFNASVDTIQSLILDANLPGRRAPNTYEGVMRMAHRGKVGPS